MNLFSKIVAVIAVIFSLYELTTLLRWWIKKIKTKK